MSLSSEDRRILQEEAGITAQMLDRIERAGFFVTRRVPTLPAKPHVVDAVSRLTLPDNPRRLT